MKPGFTRDLLRWNTRQNSRMMPWKNEKDPYRIWLSEIILQQTRVEQGWAYYEKFVNAFPTISDLAKAPQNKIFKLWEGLGYYTRCRNLITTAKKIKKEFGGKFPDNYDEIRSLSGIGPYTAAAIASFAFQLPYAVVDGNVQRVLSRYFGISTPIDTGEGKKFYYTLAESLLDHDQPGIYNQAIMDFGAVICKPRNPLCIQCVHKKSCVAFTNGWVDQLPVKEKKIQKKDRWLYYFIIESGDGVIYIRERKEKDIWQHLYEFVLQEAAGELNEKELVSSPLLKKIMGRKKFTVTHLSKIYSQKLTHQNIQGRFIHVAVSSFNAKGEYRGIRKNDISKYPFPKYITAYIASSGLVY